MNEAKLKALADDFEEKMWDIYERHGTDAELAHAEMDDLMCETLTLLGFGKGIEVFNMQDKWYS